MNAPPLFAFGVLLAEILTPGTPRAQFVPEVFTPLSASGTFLAALPPTPSEHLSEAFGYRVHRRQSTSAEIMLWSNGLFDRPPIEAPFLDYRRMEKPAARTPGDVLIEMARRGNRLQIDLPATDGQSLAGKKKKRLWCASKMVRMQTFVG